MISEKLRVTRNQVVFYLIGEKGIDIGGVPHKELDIIVYFPPDSESDITPEGAASAKSGLFPSQLSTSHFFYFR